MEPLQTPNHRKSFLGAIQYFSEFIHNLSENTANMRQLMKIEPKWDWTKDQNTDFKKVKQELTKRPCLAH